VKKQAGNRITGGFFRFGKEKHMGFVFGLLITGLVLFGASLSAQRKGWALLSLL